MPLYEYQCDACQHRFERIQKFSDPLVDTCPACGGPVHKLLSSPAIQFKGSGWYITDYARAGKGESKPGDAAPAPAKGESGGAKDGASPGDAGAKSESKAESKTESKTESTSKSEAKSESKPPSSPA